MFHRSLFAEILVGLLAVCSLARAEQVTPVVETTAGPVKGVVRTTTVAYLGIPYAEPPMGELRWRPPLPKRSWKAVLDATHFRDHCIQFPLNKLLGQRQEHASEDCLFLNVYTPRAEASKAKHPKPVMVWIHGGANIIGASDPFDSAPLIEIADVVVVSMNYRLGAFGFMAHPALDTEGHAFANYGVMDQQLALKWVRDNIAKFGGDAHNVTVFGISSGGMSVTTHLISPGSAGLFDKAIIQSGAYLLDTPSLSYAQTMGAAFASRVECVKRTAAETAACLRGLSVAEILVHLRTLLTEDNPPRMDKFLRPGGAYPQMTVDGQILPQPQRLAIDAGHIHRVPVLLGSVNNEEPEFTCGALDSLRLFLKWVPTYAYAFADPAPTPSDAIQVNEKNHGAERHYLFKSSGYFGYWGGFLDKPGAPDGPFNLPPDSQALSETMRQSWTTFAASGNPSTVRIPKWPRALDGIQRLDTTLSVVSLKDFSISHECGSDSM